MTVTVKMPGDKERTFNAKSVWLGVHRVTWTGKNGIRRYVLTRHVSYLIVRNDNGRVIHYN